MGNDSKERYLGDGVYASFDGYHIWLKTPQQAIQHQIALEPAVFDALINYQAGLMQDIQDMLKERNEEKSNGDTGI